jgi:hypothetical protein
MSAQRYPYVLRPWSEVRERDHVLWNGEVVQVVRDPTPAEGKPEFLRVPVWSESMRAGIDALVVAAQLTAVLGSCAEVRRMLDKLEARDDC